MTQKLYSACVLGLLVACEAPAEEWSDGDDVVHFRGTTPRLNTINLKKPLVELDPNSEGASLATCLAAAGAKTVNGILSKLECSVSSDPWDSNGFDSSTTTRYEFQGSGPIYSVVWVEQIVNGISQASFLDFLCSGGFIIHKGISLKNDGSVVTSPGNYFAACTNSAPGKSLSWGHPPWDGLSDFESVIRVIRADYCGNGTSFTIEGKGIHFNDDDFTEDDERPLEAVWANDGSGAICVENTRLGGPVPSCVEKCSEVDLEAVLEGSNVFAVTRLPD